MMRDAGFSEVQAHAKPKPRCLPLPADFLWQYIYSTPLVERVSKVDAERRTALEQEICDRWQALVKDGALPVEVGMTTAAAGKSAAGRGTGSTRSGLGVALLSRRLGP